MLTGYRLLREITAEEAKRDADNVPDTLIESIRSMREACNVPDLSEPANGGGGKTPPRTLQTYAHTRPSRCPISLSSNAAIGSPAADAFSPGPNALARCAALWSVGWHIGLGCRRGSTRSTRRTSGRGLESKGPRRSSVSWKHSTGRITRGPIVHRPGHTECVLSCRSSKAVFHVLRWSRITPLFFSRLCCCAQV